VKCVSVGSLSTKHSSDGVPITPGATRWNFSDQTLLLEVNAYTSTASVGSVVPAKGSSAARSRGTPFPVPRPCQTWPRFPHTKGHLTSSQLSTFHFPSSSECLFFPLLHAIKCDPCGLCMGGRASQWPGTGLAQARQPPPQLSVTASALCLSASPSASA
jgi:hypothetical protein